jgi:hypothetical protein
LDFARCGEQIPEASLKSVLFAGKLLFELTNPLPAPSFIPHCSDTRLLRSSWAFVLLCSRRFSLRVRLLNELSNSSNIWHRTAPPG